MWKSGPQATTHNNSPVLTFTCGSFAFLQRHEPNAIITFIFIAEKKEQRGAVSSLSSRIQGGVELGFILGQPNSPFFITAC